MGVSPILSVIHTITIGTKVYNNGGNTGPWLKTVLNVMCKQTLCHEKTSHL